MNLVSFLDRQNKLFWALAGIIFILAIGLIDYLTGPEMAFSLFYLIPIALLTWYAGSSLGFAASVLSALVWLIADIASGGTYSRSLIPFWNTAIRLSFFVIVTVLMSATKRSHEHVKELALTDSLTGAVNTRYFSELVMKEIERAQRYERPFTVVYLDLDNFKSVNNRFGHSVGDQMLSKIVKQAKDQLRKADTVARLGGDEFAFLMPETDQVSAQEAISRVQNNLLEEMQRHKWPVTFSIGVLTCLKAPKTSDELIRRSDDLMYSVKNNGKNSVRYAVYVESDNHSL